MRWRCGVAIPFAKFCNQKALAPVSMTGFIEKMFL
jgi:hypothetical protein